MCTVLLQHQFRSVLSQLYSLAVSTSLTSIQADLDNPVFNAALTDNGSQFCAAVNVVISASQWENGDTLYLSCNDDRSASFDMGNEVVDYSYPGFSGSFGTDFSYVDYPDGAYTFYFTANVWGC